MIAGASALTVGLALMGTIDYDTNFALVGVYMFDARRGRRHAHAEPRARRAEHARRHARSAPARRPSRSSGRSAARSASRRSGAVLGSRVTDADRRGPRRGSASTRRRSAAAASAVPDVTTLPGAGPRRRRVRLRRRRSPTCSSSPSPLAPRRARRGAAAPGGPARHPRRALELRRAPTRTADAGPAETASAATSLTRGPTGTPTNRDDRTHPAPVHPGHVRTRMGPWTPRTRSATRRARARPAAAPRARGVGRDSPATRAPRPRAVARTRLLARIAQTPDVRASELADALRGRPRHDVAPARAARPTLGLIERRPDPDDSRGQLIGLTAEGRRRADGRAAARREYVRERARTRGRRGDRGARAAAAAAHLDTRGRHDAAGPALRAALTAPATGVGTLPGSARPGGALAGDRRDRVDARGRRAAPGRSRKTPGTSWRDDERRRPAGAAPATSRGSPWSTSTARTVSCEPTARAADPAPGRPRGGRRAGTATG